MSEANSKQIGGTHYKTGGIEHWDLFGPDYLVACATKYIARNRKKNGIEDLEKALHYAIKLREGFDNHTSTWFNLIDVDKETVRDWMVQSELNPAESKIIMDLLFWNNVETVNRSIEDIQILMDNQIIDSESQARSKQWR